jgi:hypothetical protein
MWKFEDTFFLIIEMLTHGKLQAEQMPPHDLPS